MKNKKRLRSVILVSAIGAIACGGRAEESNRASSENTGGDGDGPVVGDPVGDYVGQPIGEPPYVGTGGYGFVGAVGGTGGATLVGTGGIIGVPGEPPYLGGMGGDSEESTGGATIGVPPR